jgi:hypothetical protein
LFITTLCGDVRIAGDNERGLPGDDERLLGNREGSAAHDKVHLSRETVLASSMARSSCITFSPVYPPPQLRARARSLPGRELCMLV